MPDESSLRVGRAGNHFSQVHNLREEDLKSREIARIQKGDMFTESEKRGTPEAASHMVLIESVIQLKEKADDDVINLSMSRQSSC